MSQTSILDPQTFEFVEALRLPQEIPSSNKGAASPRLETRSLSLTAWISSGGGLFARRTSRISAGTPMRERLQQPIKILMSGAGESGKTTIIKQMKVIHQGGFSSEELRDFCPQIYRNIHEAILQVLSAMEPQDIEDDDEILYKAIETIRNFKPTFDELDSLPSDYVDAINYLWVERIRHSFDALCRRAYILDSAVYFFDEINRIALPGYIPTNQDVLRARTKTTGISEYSFQSGLLAIRMIDVGGQRPERRKWIETFDGVTTLIFCVSLSEYDQGLLEEPRQNRLLESFQLWEAVINSRWFQRTSIVLFLNKKDIFRHKLRISPLQRYFAEYCPLEGASEEMQFEHAAEFLKAKFLQLNHQRLQIYPYLTCATDTNNINMVFAAVKETVLANNLRSAGIL